MVLIIKKKIQIFSNGSLHFNNSIIRKSKKIKVYNKDHITFIFNKKDANFLLNSKDFENFKTKYFRF